MEQAKQSALRVAVAALTLSAAGFGAWQANEGFSATPIIPVAGDVPTIGHGSTRYEDGTPVRMSDPPISRQRAAALARNLAQEDERRFVASLPGVTLYPGEIDIYMDFVGQYGIGNWRKPGSPRTSLLRGDYVRACGDLLQWRFQAGRDCREPRNWGPTGCRGVWLRQLRRHDACMELQQ
ncbi:glycoside hydrolase family protein [Acidovorax sp. PRC11]|uniref:glycoside hydrolase family protein n=1 Tax=Acidovorax sp. PRC11 TaxID=2962592 RepID=UPI0028817E4A|nr:lysozyme [Acidovorax sp. PRC11]MDT0137291.1 lysozyme [Acidovorax sp. PRC11]